MTHGFSDALAIVLREEGGFSHDPRDPGGTTNLGVTARVWQAWAQEIATDAVMRSLTPERVAPLYRAQYWDAIRGDQLPAALALVLFDFAVNHGARGAAVILQRIIGAAQDGAVGPATLATVNTYVARIGLAELVQVYSDARSAFYRRSDGFSTFGKGWLARVARIEAQALSWITGAA